MKYTDENRFTQDERDAMDGLARVVAFVCGVDYDELRSKTRKRKVVDARKIACKYAFDNLNVFSVHVSKTVMLPAWYFDVDHSTICHAIQTADELYEFSPAFAKLYDTVIEIVDNPLYEPDFTYEQAFARNIVWEDVRMSITAKNKDKYALMPMHIKDDIISLFNKGYGELTIANKLRTTLDFIQYFTKREGLKSNKIGNIRKALSSQSVKFGLSTSITY